MGKPRKHRRDLPERVYYKHGAYYFVHVTNKWEKLDADYQKAMARWAELIQPRAGQFTHTVGELLNRYLLEVVPGKAERTQKDNRQEVRFLRAFFGDMALTSVQPSHVAAYIEARAAKVRANREVALLSHAFNKARLWGLYAGSNPCSVPGTRNSESARTRYVTDKEVEEFKKECPPWLKEYVNLKCLLGLRQRDMLDLRWDHIDQDVFVVTAAKTGKRLAIKITPEVQEILSRLNHDSPFLFPTRSGRTYTSQGFGSIWRRVMETYVSNGHKRFTEHDLRGKVATDIEDAATAQKLLGHKSIKMTEAYIKQRQTDVVEPHRRKK